MSSDRAVVFANGEINNLEYARRVVQAGDFLIAADGGLKHMQKLEIAPALLIGDLDSIEPCDLEWAQARGALVERHPVRKEETDLELALAAAMERGYQKIIIVGGLGGRFDHALANIYLFTNPKFREHDVWLDDGQVEVLIVRTMVTIAGTPGDIVSLVPFLGPVQGIVTGGLEYPLNHEMLYPYQSRGISNVLLEKQATVQIGSGALLCIHIRQEYKE